MGQVSLDRDGKVAILTIDAPETKNALTPEMGDQLAERCDEIDGDDRIGSAVVRGAHGSFCSGGDRRRWHVDADQTEERIFREAGAVYSAFVRVGQLRVPTIAAVRGAAVGAGMNLMLATDLRVVALDAALVAGFLKIGLHPGGGYFTLSSRAAGRETTAAMGLFSAEIDGRRAEQLGFVWEALPDDEVEPRALHLAAIAAEDPELSREAVRSFRTELGPPAMPWESALHFERATQMWSQRRRNRR